MYYGIYRSSTSAQTGCVKQIATTAQEQMQFPPQISFSCDLCNTTHNFRYVSAMRPTTESQKKNFFEFCLKYKIESDVNIS